MYRNLKNNNITFANKCLYHKRIAESNKFCSRSIGKMGVEKNYQNHWMERKINEQ